MAAETREDTLIRATLKARNIDEVVMEHTIGEARTFMGLVAAICYENKNVQVLRIKTEDVLGQYGYLPIGSKFLVKVGNEQGGEVYERYKETNLFYCSPAVAERLEVYLNQMVAHKPESA